MGKRHSGFKRAGGAALGFGFVVVVVTVAAVVTSPEPVHIEPYPPGSSTSADSSGGGIDALRVLPELSMAGYSRARFPHWSQQGGGCDTRERVLRRQGTEVTNGPNCSVTGGLWTSVYDGVVVTEPSQLDVDHVVPLAEAWRSGASKWTDAQREVFANDLDRPQLRAVTASSNRSKGDQDPARWKPPDELVWCVYAQDWVAVKVFYHLAADQAEVDELKFMLGRC